MPSTGTIELTDDNYDSWLSRKEGILLIDFWAEWCPPCKAFAPIYEAAANKHTDLVFAKVNTEQARGLASAFEVTSIPTIAIFRDGILLFLQPGALPAPVLEDVIQKVKSLDMDEVRRQASEEKIAATAARA